jgi:hypothetical protein
MSFPLGDFVTYDQEVIIEYPHVLVFYTQEELFSDKRVGDNIAVAFKPDGTVLENVSINPVRSVKGLGWKKVYSPPSLLPRKHRQEPLPV